MSSPRWLTVIALVFCLAAAGAAPGRAEYFGRNKVQYDKFRFQTASTEHFDLLYYSESEAAMKDAGRMLERWHARVGSVFKTVLRKHTVILYANDADFQQTNILPGLIGQGIGGATEGVRQRMVLPLNGTYEDIDHVLGHELVHVFQFSVAEQLAWAGSQGGRLPSWFIEGMPEYLSLGGRHSQTAMWLREALLRNKLPTLDDLTLNPEYFPYRWGHALWAYIGGRWGDDAVNRLFRVCAIAGWDRGIESVLKVTPKQLSQDWHASIRSGYGPFLEGRDLAGQTGQRLDLGSEVNLAPSLSPDGSKLVCFSQRDIFTIELYLYDLKQKKMTRKLSTSLRSGHFDALRFVDSAGAWSPDSQHFCLVTYSRGANALTVVNTGNGSLEDVLRFDSIASIANPAWSPDGGQIAFTGSRGGIMDLYVVRRSDKQLKQLTRDAFAELQPSWSPDGRTIAVATDRGPGTDFHGLTYGRFQIGMVETETGAVTLLPLFPAADHSNPVFGPDGRSLFFVADRSGFSDIYRFDLEDQSLWQVTRLATGVSGLTPRSPALSVAARSGHVAFSVYENNGYQINLLTPEAGAGTRVAAAAPGLHSAAFAGQEQAAGPPVPDPAILPGQGRPSPGVVAAYLNDTKTGLPEGGAQNPRKYQPQLQLEWLGATFAGAVANQFGGLGGGIAAQFSDLLNNHTVGAAANIPGDIRDFSIQGLYWNAENRVNWGGSALRLPYFSYRPSFTETTVDGQPAIRLQQVVDRVTLYQAQALAAYPVSTIQRLEVGAAYSHYGFERTLRDTVFQNNLIVSDVTTSGQAPPPLSVAAVPIAWVSDDSYFGFTAPVRGERFRLQIEPNFGSLVYHNLLADYRRYFFHRRFTLAVRALHYGHYGPASEDNQVSQLYVGDSYFVRGYEFYTFDLANQDEGLSLDHLSGSRLAVLNLELRVPVLGTADYGLAAFPYLPLDLAVFADSGVGWMKNALPDWRFGSLSERRTPVVSAGLAARINLAGVLVLEFYWAYPFQHPAAGWHLGFQIVPGW